MFKKIVMIEEGDIGIVFSEKIKDEGMEEYLNEFVECGCVEYNSKEECFNIFMKNVGDLEDEEYKGCLMEKIEKMKNYEGEWFVGDNMEYVIMIGCEFESENGDEVIDNNGYCF